MTQKVALIADPGIDTAFALTLALFDPTLEVLAVAASAGNVSALQATLNVQTVLALTDPPRRPRIGAALAVDYPYHGTALHGPGGLGGLTFPDISLHQPMPADKLLVEIARQSPKEVTVICLGPSTTLARALDRDPEFAEHVERFVILGGTWHDPGNTTAVGEFHFCCDPLAAQQVLRAGVPTTVLPLDVTRELVFSPTDLLELPVDSAACRFLRQIVPYGIRATSNVYGIEGFHLKDVLGVIAVTLPQAITTQPVSADVETRGELTRGMLVVDVRSHAEGPRNIDLATEVDVVAVRDYIARILRRTAET